MPLHNMNELNDLEFGYRTKFQEKKQSINVELLFMFSEITSGLFGVQNQKLISSKLLGKLLEVYSTLAVYVKIHVKLQFSSAFF